VVDAGSAPLLKPLKLASTVPAPPTGSVYRLAGYGSAKFNDEDSATFAAGIVTEDNNPLFAQASLAAKTLYAFYVTATPAAPSAFSVTVAGPATVTSLGTAGYAASEVDANGFPFLNPSFAFSLDRASLGSIAAATGAFAAGPVDGTGNVVATDTLTGHGSVSGKTAVAVGSQRPGNVGDAFTYTGTLTTTTQLANSNVTTQPQTDTAAVALKATVLGFTPSAGGGQNAIHSDETDAYALQTIKTSTDGVYAYATGPTNATLSIVSSAASDSNGVGYSTTFGAGNGLLDVLPETQGTFGPNTAALTYAEKDQAGYARSRTVASDGSYVETGTDSLADIQTIKNFADFSATYDATQYSGYNFVLSAPVGSPAVITVAVKTGTTTRATYHIPSWIPPGASKVSAETDVDNGATPYPAGCSVPSKYGTQGNQLVQTIQRIDPALGNAETQTTTTYLAPGVGPVCVQLADTVLTFYDYTLQNGYVVYVSNNALPLQATSLNETLTLQSASVQNGTVTSSLKRGTSSMPRSAFAPLAFARARFERAVRERLGSRNATFSRSFLSQGVRPL
jgi:hypothetical protein